MKIRTEWQQNNSNEILDRFYSKQETVDEVIENFDIRRHYSAEGEQITIREQTDWCLVQTSSNPLKELDDLRKIHCPMSMDIRRGDYVEYDNSIWLIDTNVVNVGNAYQSTRMNRCSYVLRWQNEQGEIIERPIISYNATSYNNGVKGNNTLQIGTDQLMVMLPYDDETKRVKRNKKFFIDNNMEDPMVYELTRPDRTTYVFEGTGYIQWMVTECAYTPNSLELEMGICGYTDINLNTDETDDESVNQSPLLYQINYSGTPVINIGNNYKQFNGLVTDEDLNEVSEIGIWNIMSDFTDKLEIDIEDNQIRIQTSDTSLSGRTFELKFSNIDSSISDTILISISDYA